MHLEHLDVPAGPGEAHGFGDETLEDVDACAGVGREDHGDVPRQRLLEVEPVSLLRSVEPADETPVAPDPIAQFEEGYLAAEAADLWEPNAAVVATADGVFDSSKQALMDRFRRRLQVSEEDYQKDFDLYLTFQNLSVFSPPPEPTEPKTTKK